MQSVLVSDYGICFERFFVSFIEAAFSHISRVISAIASRFEDRQSLYYKPPSADNQRQTHGMLPLVFWVSTSSSFSDAVVGWYFNFSHLASEKTRQSGNRFKEGGGSDKEGQTSLA